MFRAPIRNALAAVSTVAALLAAPAASAFNYTYVEGGYGDIDIDYYDDSGFRLAGSFDVAPQVALIGEYADWGDLSQLSLGAIFHAPIQKDLDFFAGGTFERVDLDGYDDDTGFGLRAGLRWQIPNLPVQLIPEVRYLDVADDTLTSFRVTGLFTIAPRLDLVAGLQSGDDDRLELGARYNF